MSQNASLKGLWFFGWAIALLVVYLVSGSYKILAYFESYLRLFALNWEIPFLYYGKIFIALLFLSCFFYGTIAFSFSNSFFHKLLVTLLSCILFVFSFFCSSVSACNSLSKEEIQQDFQRGVISSKQYRYYSMFLMDRDRLFLRLPKRDIGKTNDKKKSSCADCVKLKKGMPSSPILVDDLFIREEVKMNSDFVDSSLGADFFIQEKEGEKLYLDELVDDPILDYPKPDQAKKKNCCEDIKMKLEK